MLKFRWDTSIGSELRNCTLALSRVAFWKDIRTLQSNNKTTHILLPPACSSPTSIRSSAWQLAGPVHENGQSLTTQSVWYHSLSDIISFCLKRELHVCYQLGQAKWRVGSNVYIQNVFVFALRAHLIQGVTKAVRFNITEQNAILNTMFSPWNC